MAKFAEGEAALLIEDRYGRPTTTKCQVLKYIGLFRGAPCYYCDIPAYPLEEGKLSWIVQERILRKLPPKEEPSSDKARFKTPKLTDWDKLEQVTGWNPTKETAENE